MSKRKTQMQFTRAWVSEKDSGRQLLWTYLWASIVIALTVLSRLY